MSGGINGIQEDQALQWNITAFNCPFLTEKDSKEEIHGSYQSLYRKERK